jgi:hypothetical protein
MSLLLHLAAAPPLDPTREAARQWALVELSDAAYAQAQPGPVQRAVTWLLDHLPTLNGFGGPSQVTATVLLLLVLALVVVVVLLRTGRLRGPGARTGARAVFDQTGLSAADHRTRADAAAAAGRWADAVLERFRAVVRSLEERVVIDERPGRTAFEAATQAGRVLPDCSGDLLAGAEVFDEVVYGERTATAADDERLRALQTRLLAARRSRGDDRRAPADRLVAPS